MAERFAVAPALLQWARKRSGREVSDFLKVAPQLERWEAGEAQPTIKQLEQYANATHTPLGYFFLPEPPVEKLPINDFRTFGNQFVVTPTPDLLDTIYMCQQRQDWYRRYAESHGHEPLAWVGSAQIGDSATQVANNLRDLFGFSLAQRVEYSTWTDALTGLIEHAEAAGVLVMVNGIVGNNTHRRLNPDEFRGFALADDLAPVVFINGADTKAAQIFTLAHELAHLTLGQSVVSKPDLGTLGDENPSEDWCNRVGAELLVPAQSLRGMHDPTDDLIVEANRLARFYKVSSLVALRRIFDVGLVSWAPYRAAYDAELARILALTADKPSGGNFHYNTPIRVSRRFARALVADTHEGNTLYRDAFRLVGSRSAAVFEELGERVGAA